jgi:hypothetical protein
MRRFSRTLLARTFAALISILAASPLTAPFMTCDWSELGHVRTDAVAHVSRHLIAAPDAKTPIDPNTTMFTVAVTTANAGDGARQKSSRLPVAPEPAPVRVIALRI